MAGLLFSSPSLANKRGSILPPFTIEESLRNKDAAIDCLQYISIKKAPKNIHSKITIVQKYRENLASLSEFPNPVQIDKKKTTSAEAWTPAATDALRLPEGVRKDAIWLNVPSKTAPPIPCNVAASKRLVEHCISGINEVPRMPLTKPKAPRTQNVREDLYFLSNSWSHRHWAMAMGTRGR